MNYKIYKIVDRTNDNVYIGQTSQDIRKRIGQHKSNFKKSLKDKRFKNTCSSRIILANDDWYYQVIIYNLNKYQAETLERELILERENCINICKYNYNPKLKYNYEKSWGGPKCSDNNLLLIDVERLFN